MRIIKPYGRSVVANNNQSDKTLKRQLEIGARARETTTKEDNGLHDVQAFLGNDPDFFIAQWASMLDKLLFKPQTQDKNNKPTTATYAARDKAGHAFFDYWQTNNLIPKKADIAKFKKKWFLKVHPYGESSATQEDKDDSAKITRRWYKVLGGDDSIENTDWKKIAAEVYSHLYQKQKKLKGKSRDQGLIEIRANSITKNAKKFSLENDIFTSLSASEQRHIQALKKTDETDWKIISKSYQLDQLITDLNQKEQIDSKRSVSRQKAIACLNQHYGRVFGKETTIADAKKQTDLWLYHCMIKEALYFQYPKPQRRAPRHPVNTNKLHNLAISIEANRQMAFAIRLGKVIHYQGGLQATEPDNSQQIINSSFWTSKGQTQIKQNESFVRQWLAAIAIAYTTLERLLDPSAKINNDLLVARGFKAVMLQFANPAAEAEFDPQFKLLFGKKHELYQWNTGERLNIIKDLRETLANLRHASFHFKKIDDFKTALEPLKIKTPSETVLSYINRHQNIQQNVIIKTLESAHIQEYLNQKQIDVLLETVQQTDRNLFPLPKFNKLLLRATNTEQKLIHPADAEKMQNQAYQCCFISLKMLYDRGFSTWLEQQETDCLNNWIKQAKERATSAAKKINGNKNEDIQSKMAQLRELDNNETLIQYFSYLTSETAIEFQVQQQHNAYNSDSETAKEQSNFVEQFKQDVLVLGFIDFIAKKHLSLLCKEDQLSPLNVASELPKAAEPNTASSDKLTT